LLDCFCGNRVFNMGIEFCCHLCCITVVFRHIPLQSMDQGSSVSIATGYRLDSPGIESWWGQDFSHMSIPALGVYPASCTVGTGSFPGVNRPERDADNTSSSAKVMKG
jgi:hypothetical protein